MNLDGPPPPSQPGPGSTAFIETNGRQRLPEHPATPIATAKPFPQRPIRNWI